VAIALIACSVGCKRTPHEGDDAVITSGRWGGLDVQVVSPPGAAAKGGPALVLLHGFGGSHWREVSNEVAPLDSSCAVGAPRRGDRACAGAATGRTAGAIPAARGFADD
jgi:pimeloyl-ACP methyl ester carboxylesterase